MTAFVDRVRSLYTEEKLHKNLVAMMYTVSGSIAPAGVLKTADEVDDCSADGIKTRIAGCRDLRLGAGGKALGSY
jgi:hypothetical protein